MRAWALAALLMTLPHPDAPTRQLPSRYVSIDCPAGDITLTLAEDGSFNLDLAHWNEATATHTSHDVLTGGWRVSGSVLTLQMGDLELQYVQDTAAIRLGSREYRIASLRWSASTKPTFADGLWLLEQEAIDRALKEATPDATRGNL